jgi:DNA-binding NtrC family response regulator
MLLDLALPDLDGLAVLRSVMEIYPNLPVIIMTAYAAEEKAVALFQPEFDATYSEIPPNMEAVKCSIYAV